MVLPIDKSAKSFNVSVVKLNQSYDVLYKKQSKQAVESKQKTQDLRETMYFEENKVLTHERVSYWINLLRESLDDSMGHI